MGSKQGLGERIALGASKEAAQEVIRRTVPRLTPRMTRRTAAAQARAVIGEGRRLAGKAIGGAAALAKSPVGALGARALGAAAAAGIASYTITSKILQNIKDRKERKAQERFLAAQAYRKARLAAQKAKGGRALTSAEHAELAAEFKARLAEI